MDESLQIRVHGDPANSCVIYLPGTHGDWTMIGEFRRAIPSNLCFVEFTYPRSRYWTLRDYAEAVERALAERGIAKGWVVAESFGSQVAWELLKRKESRFSASGLILAGGFARHPWRRSVKLSRLILRLSPLWMLRGAMRGLMALALSTRDKSDELRKELGEFVKRRTDADRGAAAHRLRLIETNDSRAIGGRLRLPVYYLGGAVDLLVPWRRVCRELEDDCPSFKGRLILPAGGHGVLFNAPTASAKFVQQCMDGVPCAKF